MWKALIFVYGSLLAEDDKTYTSEHECTTKTLEAVQRVPGAMKNIESGDMSVVCFNGAQHVLLKDLIHKRR